MSELSKLFPQWKQPKQNNGPVWSRLRPLLYRGPNFGLFLSPFSPGASRMDGVYTLKCFLRYIPRTHWDVLISTLRENVPTPCRLFWQCQTTTYGNMTIDTKIVFCSILKQIIKSRENWKQYFLRVNNVTRTPCNPTSSTYLPENGLPQPKFKQTSITHILVPLAPSVTHISCLEMLNCTPTKENTKSDEHINLKQVTCHDF